MIHSKPPDNRQEESGTGLRAPEARWAPHRHPGPGACSGTHFEVEAGHNGQLFHGELLGGLLVAMATATLDLGTAS